jgi:hypothetical protein
MEAPTLRNVHARRLAAPIERVRPWIESCWTGCERDCFPRDVISSWRRNPPGVDPAATIPGVTIVGHGPFRFRLRRWDGHAWTVDLVGGMAGWHGFDLAADGDACRVTHTIELAATPSTRLRWALIAPVHDWAVEALFDRLERALATGVVPARTDRPMPRLVALELALLRRRPRRAAVMASDDPRC